MRTASTQIRDFLLANNQAWKCHLYTITLVDGTIYRWTSASESVTIDGQTWHAPGDAPIVEHSQMRSTAGLGVDTLDMAIRGPYLIGGVALGALATSGHFRGAAVVIDRVFGEHGGDVALGRVASIYAGSVAVAEPDGYDLRVRVKSIIERLNLRLPRYIFSPQCGHPIYSTACGVARATYTQAGTVSASTATTVTTATAGITALGGAYYDLGVLLFTSGALAGKRFSIASWASPVFTLSMPLLVQPEVGDSFSAWPGCDRQFHTCADRFDNTRNHRGFPSMPKKEGT